MRRPRLTIIPGGRDGQPERRKTPRRPPADQVRLVEDDATPLTPVRRARAVRGGGAAAAAAPKVERRAVNHPAADVFARTARGRRSVPVSVWVFAIVAMAGVAAAVYLARPLLGIGLVLLGTAGLLAPPRRVVEPRIARISTGLSVAGVVLVGIDMIMHL